MLISPARRRVDVLYAMLCDGKCYQPRGRHGLDAERRGSRSTPCAAASAAFSLFHTSSARSPGGRRRPGRDAHPTPHEHRRSRSTAAVLELLKERSQITAFRYGPPPPSSSRGSSNMTEYSRSPARATRFCISCRRSSTCPNLPVTVRADGPSHLVIKTKQSATLTACTLDLAPSTSTVALPSNIDLPVSK